MMKPMILALSIVAGLGVMPAVAQNVQSSDANLYELIDLSDGYFSIRENVVMIEGESEIKACHFGLSTEFFAAYGAGDAAGVEATQPAVVCVPLEAMNVVPTQSTIDSSRALYDFIDTSESYVQVKQGIVMIEGETEIEFCHFDLTDAYFAAVAAKDDAAMAINQPNVTCAPFSDVSK